MLYDRWATRCPAARCVQPALNHLVSGPATLTAVSHFYVLSTRAYAAVFAFVCVFVLFISFGASSGGGGLSGWLTAERKRLRAGIPLARYTLAAALLFRTRTFHRRSPPLRPLSVSSPPLGHGRTPWRRRKNACSSRNAFADREPAVADACPPAERRCLSKRSWGFVSVP